MSTYEESQLTARFAALAPEPLPGDWDDVLARAGAARKSWWRLEGSRPLQGRRRRLLVVFAVVTLVVAVGTAAAFAVRAVFFDKGFIGPPPEGATPSTPEHGELVLFYFGLTGKETGKSAFWLYADGRLISEHDGDVPGGANARASGFLEQRLTSEGVELFLAEVISTGLIGHEDDYYDGAGPWEHDPPTDDDVAIGSEPVPWDTSTPAYTWETANGPPGSLWWDLLQVRHDGQLYRIGRIADVKRLHALFHDPASWLPASAWEVQAVRAYVPTRFDVCFGAPDPLAQFLDLLPRPAQQMLRGREFASRPHGAQGCTYMTNEEAAALARELDAAGIERDGINSLQYSLDTWVHITFEPLLPHGQSWCSPCG